MGRRYYHRRRYNGKRKTERGRRGLTVLLVLLFTAVVIFLSILLGLKLREKAEKLREENDFLATVESDTPAPKPENTDAEISKHMIHAPFVSVSSPKDISIEGDADFISTVFKNEAGVIYYKSPALEAVSGPQSPELPSADSLIGKLTQNESKVSAVFLRENTEGMDEIAERAVLDIAVSQMCEIAKAGASEIMIMCLDTSDGELEFFSSAADKIRAASPETLVGIVLPFSAVSGGEPSALGALCQRAADSFDIIAADMTALEDTETASGADQLASILDRMQICFTRFNIRCVFSDSYNDPDALTAPLRDAALENLQFISKTGEKTEFSAEETENDNT